MSGAKILWVDDEIDLLKPHILFLKGKGYDVETCNNGYDAIDLVAARQFDLVILDEMMPGLTGLETLPRIKELRPMTPVIMVTKSEEENIMDKAVGSKIADYLFQRILFVGGVTLYGAHQIRNQVGATLILILNVAQLRRSGFAAADHIVVTSFQP